MKDTEDQLRAALRAAVARLPEAAREPLYHAVAPGVIDPREAQSRVAVAMADPAWVRTALRDLPVRGRAALRLAVRVAHAVPWAELESLVGALPDPDERAPLPLLVRRGLLTVWVERHFNRFEERKVAPLDPLRDRLAVLLQDEPAVGAPPVRDDEEQFLRARFDLQVGVLAAVVEQSRPRVTRYTELHRSDMRAIVDQVATLLGGTDEALRLLDRLVRQRLFLAEDGRLRLAERALARWPSALGRMLLARLEERQGSTILRVALGTLLLEPGWVSEARLLEACAVAALETFDNHCLRRVREELGVLAALPGVRRTTLPEGTFWRVSAPAREVLEGMEPVAGKGGLLVQPNLQIVVSPGCAFPVVARLGRLAKLVSADQVALFALDEQTVRRAAAEGFGAGEMLELLERSSSHGVPSTVARAISDWARPRGHVRIAVGTVLQTDLPIEEVRRLVGPKAIVRKLADGWLQTDAVSAVTILSALRKAGVACQPFEGETLEEDEEEGDDWPRPDSAEEEAPTDLAATLRADAQRVLRVQREE